MADEEFWKPTEVPDGEYRGHWGGYTLSFVHDGSEVRVRTELGVRGMNIPVTFRIVDGKLDNKSIKTH